MRAWIPALATVVYLLPLLPAQGLDGYLNFETSQVKPITVAQVGGRHYVCVCNTPDGSLEIYDAHDLVFEARLRTGLEPVSVTAVAETFDLVALYVCNHIGDSVTRLELRSNPQLPPGSNATPNLVFDRTVFVADAPNHYVQIAGAGHAAVTTATSYATFLIDPLTLASATPGQDNERVLTGPAAVGSLDYALTQPRTAIWEPSLDRLFVLGFMDGHQPEAFQVAICDDDSHVQETISGLSNVTFNMAIAPASGGADNWLFVVGSESREAELTGEATVADDADGFVLHHLHRVDLDNDTDGVTVTDVQTRNLNHAGTPAALVPVTQRVSQPTDVVVLGGGPDVFVTSFGTDRVLRVRNVGAPAADWLIDVVNIVPINATAMAGPRGLAVAPTNIVVGTSERLFVLNRLDNSVSCIDPATFVDSGVTTFSLQNDPTPQFIREGRRFLYDARLSLNQMVSCASCHIDAGMDQLAWNLGSDDQVPEPDPVPVPDGYLDGITGFLTTASLDEFRNGKGTLVTQSLKGLLNHPVDRQTQEWLTNAPYHWRGDRFSFLDFRGAFSALLRAPETGAGSVTATDMEAFEAMIGSVAYPPNPEMPLTRRHSAVALQGMEQFHTQILMGPAGGVSPVCAGRSCVHCHALPVGSNRHATCNFDSTQGSPLESPALRNLTNKDASYVTPGRPSWLPPYDATSSTLDTNVRAGGAGTGRIGEAAGTVNDNVLGMGSGPEFAPSVDFVRQLDTGTAPIVGRSITVDTGNRSDPDVLTRLDLFEAQANEANAGLVVHGWLAATAQGWWFDPLFTGTNYRAEPGTTASTRAALLQSLAKSDDRLVFEAVPLGSERRRANPTGLPPAATAQTPQLEPLLELRPTSPYEVVPTLYDNWDPLAVAPIVDFEWIGMTLVGIPEPRTLLVQRQMQHILTEIGYGTRRHHDAPRRVRIAGQRIEPGATLELTIHPYNSAYRTGKVSVLKFPIYPTNERHNGAPIWTTSADLAPPVYYYFMLGGRNDSRAVQIVEEPNNLGEQPVVTTWLASDPNSHRITVINPGPTAPSATLESIPMTLWQ